MTKQAQSKAGRARQRLSALSRRAPPAGDSRVADLQARVKELEREMQESRRLNRRLAELTDVVQELLIPLAQQDTAKFDDYLKKYSDRI